MAIEYGKSKFELHDLRGAIDLFASVELGSDQYISSQCYIARSYRQLGMETEAIHIFNSILVLDPLCDDASVSLAEIYASRGDSLMSQSYAAKAPSLLLHPSLREDTDSTKKFAAELFQKLSYIEEVSELESDNVLSLSNQDEKRESLIACSSNRRDVRRPRRPRISALNTSLLKYSKPVYVFEGLIPFRVGDQNFPFTRSISYLRYGEQECKQVRLLYKRSLILLTSASKDEFLMAAGLLVSDFINNGHFYREGHGELRTFSSRSLRKAKKSLVLGVYHDPEIFTIIHALSRDICPNETNRGLRETLLQASHGLTVQEWFDVIFKVFVDF